MFLITDFEEEDDDDEDEEENVRATEPLRDILVEEEEDTGVVPF